jgi:hypothetical protein
MTLVFRTPNRRDVNEAIRGLHFLSHRLILQLSPGVTQKVKALLAAG